MAKIESEIHQDCMKRFIDLANVMKEEGIGTNVVSAGLMTASGIYATFVAGGNEGGLTPSGVEKVTGAYKEQLEKIQALKKQRNAQQAKG
jgi:hypothetical protein